MKKYGLFILFVASLLLLFSCESDPSERESYTLTATVAELGEKIAVEIIEAPDGNTGIFLVITPENAVYLDEKGGEISRIDISVGDKVRITYSGQVMMSYPAQIVAHEIQVIG